MMAGRGIKSKATLGVGFIAPTTIETAAEFLFGQLLRIRRTTLGRLVDL
jgi:hypothetical protein